jgi:dTDP-4-amino-4,6-dideoxy-D-glucose transaminase
MVNNNNDQKPIYITKPCLPQLSEFTSELEKIWNTRILTNMGPYHQELEKQLKEYLNVPYISLFSNATSALYTALKILKLENCDIITTPFSFPATSHVIKLVGSNPMFEDIEPQTCCMNIEKIEELITIGTKAILPVHVYGNSCDIDMISKIANKYDLKVIYDAAHCFAPNNDILRAGDLSVLSFHATKIFNTLEGGAIISHDLETKQSIDRFCNFGIDHEDVIPEIGFNAKMNEIQALIGILNLKDIDSVLEKRKIITERYDKNLNNKIEKILSTNNSYYPILVDDRDSLYNRLKDNTIYARKYFYPLISNLKPYQSITTASKLNLPISNKIADKILCLPLYPDLKEEEQDRIIELVNRRYHN